jgi:hypothetical protein
MNLILTALGCTTEDEALALVNKFNSFLADARIATGTAGLETALAAIQTNASVVRSLDALTGKTGGESVALATAWKSGAADADKLRAEIATINKNDADAKANAAIEAVIADGRLEPAKRADFDKLYQDFGTPALTAALNALPAGRAPTELPAPKQPTQAAGATGPATAFEKSLMKATGKSLQDLRTAAKEWDELETDTPSGRGVFFTRKTAA